MRKKATTPTSNLLESIAYDMWEDPGPTGTWGCESALDVQVIAAGFLQRLLEQTLPSGKQSGDEEHLQEIYCRIRSMIEHAEEKGWI